jgi:indole-3-glycerol phosphate synthase
VHNEEELKKSLDAGADLIGVNNRDLKTFQLSIEVSKKLAPLIPQSMVKVSESGIDSVAAILELKQHGYEGFLMGQNFMQHSRPEVAAKEFIDELHKATSKKLV